MFYNFIVQFIVNDGKWTMMNKLFCFALLIATIFISACQPPVTFDKPQPADVDELAAFPGRLQGKFLSVTDGSILQITQSQMIRVYDFELCEHISQLDSTQQIIGDTLYDIESGKGMAVQIEGDSIIWHLHHVDTVFNLNSSNVLKKLKGYYFVNMQTPSGTWQVKKLEISRGTITLGSIKSKAEIEQLIAITDTVAGNASYVFSPTRRQFSKFVRQKGFRNIEKFNRIRE